MAKSNWKRRGLTKLTKDMVRVEVLLVDKNFNQVKQQITVHTKPIGNNTIERQMPAEIEVSINDKIVKIFHYIDVQQGMPVYMEK